MAGCVILHVQSRGCSRGSSCPTLHCPWGTVTPQPLQPHSLPGEQGWAPLNAASRAHTLHPTPAGLLQHESLSGCQLLSLLFLFGRKREPELSAFLFKCGQPRPFMTIDQNQSSCSDNSVSVLSLKGFKSAISALSANTTTSKNIQQSGKARPPCSKDWTTISRQHQINRRRHKGSMIFAYIWGHLTGLGQILPQWFLQWFFTNFVFNDLDKRINRE